VNTNGTSGNGSSRGSVMTGDGRYIAFVSTASNLVPGDTNNIADVFVRDLQAGTTTLASVGATTNTIPPVSGSVFGSESPEITPDGHYVAFYSNATNLVPGVATNGEIFVRDLFAGKTFGPAQRSHPFPVPVQRRQCGFLQLQHQRRRPIRRV